MKVLTTPQSTSLTAPLTRGAKKRHVKQFYKLQFIQENNNSKFHN